MNILEMNVVQQYVENNIGEFHKKRIENLEILKLDAILKRKNPYLFKAKNILTSSDLIKSIVDAHASSSEETIFGDWLEGLAIFINGKVFGGWKSGIAGIDLEFDNDGNRYIISIKSGPNWGNSRQINKMKDDFRSAKRSLRTSNSGLNIISVNGCCYGKDNNPDKGEYFKYCGQFFWEFISRNSTLYIELIEPLGYKAKEKNDQYMQSYGQLLNRFTRDFSNTYCNNDGKIDWNKLIKMNSSVKITAP